MILSFMIYMKKIQKQFWWLTLNFHSSNHYYKNELLIYLKKKKIYTQIQWLKYEINIVCQGLVNFEEFLSCWNSS